MIENLDKLLRESKVIVCAGSGGVGKTTISASLGTRAAGLGLKTLVLTVDPAKRLATALGLDLSDDNEKRVPGQNFTGELYAAVIDSRKTFDQFIARHAADKTQADRILRNRLYQQLSTTLSGSQEFTSLERLLEAVESKRFDLVILDTPPTKHAMDFFTAPQRIHALFQDSVTKWFMGGGNPGGFISGLISRGTRTVLKSLEILTGGQFIEELVDFFAAMRAVQKTLRDRSVAVQKLLSSSSVKFFVITSFDAAKIEEAKYLHGALKKLGFSLEAVIINRAFPLWLHDEARQKSLEANDPATQKVLLFFEEFRKFHSFRYSLYEDFAKSLKGSANLFRIPDFGEDVSGLADLQKLANRLGEATT
jgi:anion-transporting  ArsA/GET3 family ATPase